MATDANLVRGEKTSALVLNEAGKISNDHLFTNNDNRR